MIPKRRTGKALVAMAAMCMTIATLHGQAEVKDTTVYELSAFEVNTDNDQGYTASNAVTGTRVQEEIRNVPLNMQVLTAEVLEDVMATEPSDALNFAASVNKKNPERPFNHSGGVFIRGYEQSWSYRNGIRVFDQPTAANVARVELIKGPAAVLYGLTPPGGLYNVITKKPIMGNTFYEVSATIGTHDYYRGTLDANLGEISDKVGIRFNALYSEPHTTLWDPFPAKDQSYSPTITYRPTEKTEIRLEYEHMDRVTAQGASLTYRTRSDPDSPGSAIPVQADYPDIPWDYNWGGGQNPQNTVADSWFLTLNQTINDDWSFQVVTSWIDRYAQSDGYRQDNYNGTRIRRRYQKNRFSNWGYTVTTNVLWTPEWESEALGNVENKFLFGGQYQDGQFSQVFYREFKENGGRVAYSLFPENYPDIDLGRPEGFDPAVDASRVGSRDRQEDGHNKQFYSTWTTKLWEETLIVSAGVFYTDIYESGWEISGGERSHYYIRGEDTKPMIGAVYRPADWLSLFLLKAESYETFTSARDPFGRSFDPVSGESWEGGFKVDAMEGRLSGTISFYEIKQIGRPVNLGQIPDPTLPEPAPGEPDDRPLVNNFQAVGESTSEGIDVDLLYKPIDEWQILFSYAYNDTYISHDPDPEIVGQRPPLHALNRVGLLTKYSFLEGELDGFAVSLGLNWSDKAIRRDGGYITDPATGDRVARFQDESLDAQLGLHYNTVIAGKDTSFQLTVRNLLEDEMPARGTYKPDPNGGLATKGYYRPVERQFLFTVRMRF